VRPLVQTTLVVVLLAAGVVGALTAPGRRPLALVPVLAALFAIVVGAVHLSTARHALDALAEPLAFLLLAVPLAALLDELGVFDAASRVVSGRRVAAGCWVLGCIVVAVFNLDTAVVLLTPLYARLARRVGVDAVALAFQPALLACLASCALPVSNLTNLIVWHETDVGTGDFLSTFLVPTVVACGVGYWAWRYAFRSSQLVPTAPASASGPDDGRPLVIGAVVVAALLTGFVFGGAIGVAPWVVVGVVDLVLVLLTRLVPWRAAPVDPALLAAALAVLAAGVAAHVDLGRLLSGSETSAAIVRNTGVTAVLANATNNLPAFLVLFPFAAHRPYELAAVLLGANLGPVLLVTGSLSGLLWLTVARNEGLAVGPRAYFRAGLVAGVPALVAATIALTITAGRL
jgi:arsenical pump membrane protein